MYRIGVDIGGTGIQAGLVNSEGKIIGKKECATDVKGGFVKVVGDMEELIYGLLEEFQLKATDIERLGFGVPSPINKKGMVSCVNLGWKEVPFMQTLKETFSKFEVAAENDATVAAVAETHFGSMKDCFCGVLLTLGTGVGGGIIINGQPFAGAHGMGSELGHVIIGENDYNCNCGNNGCFETFCSATGIIKYTKKLLENGEESSLTEACRGDLSRLNAKKVFDAYRLGDEIAVKSIERFKRYLAIGIANIINSIDPAIISLGGGVSRAGDIILDGLEEQVRGYILNKNEEFAKIVIAELGNEAGIVGAAFL